MDPERLIFLPEVDSTNKYAKEHYAELPALCAVYTTCQTAGRGRLGRAWLGSRDQALYYTAVFKTPMVQPGTLPLLCALAVRDVLERRYGVRTQVKWPNDLLLKGKKLVGILCEGMFQADQPGIVAGIGINLAQPAEYFAERDLPHGGSLAELGLPVDVPRDAAWLADALTNGWFAQRLPLFAAQGFAPFLQEYRRACINLGLPVIFDEGRGIARDVDAEGNLVVETETGERRVFTGEVSVKGVYGAV